jgi:hypothetical protein
VVFRAIKRLFGGAHEGPAGVSPEQAELRLKALKARLAKNKSEAKRVYSEIEKTKNLSPERKAEGKARLKELEAERKDILRDMKGLHKRLPKGKK